MLLHTKGIQNHESFDRASNCKDETINHINIERDSVLEARVVALNDYHLTKWEAIKKYPFACICIITMVWTLILTSFESQAGGIVISISQFRKHFGEELSDGSYVIAANWQSIFSGVPLAAQIIGQWVSSFLVDSVGKKWVLWITVLISLAFVGMEFAATEIHLFVAGKVLNGFCLGIIQPAAVSYVSDIAPLALRGSATTLCNISFSVGPLICFIINYCLSGKPANDAWAYRALFASQWGFAVVSLVLILFVPESPTFYILKGKMEKANEAYRKLLKDSIAAKEQLNVVSVTVKEAKTISEGSTFFDLFRGLNLKRTMIATVPFMICPNSGVYFTASYTTYYFQLSGFDDSKSFRFTCGAQTISLTGCLVSLYISDLFGRRKGMIYGLLAVLVVDLIIGGAGTATDNSLALDTTVAFMMLYGGIYNALVGSLAYPICAENPTSALRAKTIALGMASTNTWSMFWSFVLPYIFNPNHGNLGAKTMFIFAGLSGLFLIYLYFFQTETAGRSYDEIDELYGSKVPLRKFDSFMTKTHALNKDDKKINEKIEKDHLEHAEIFEGKQV